MPTLRTPSRSLLIPRLDEHILIRDVKLLEMGGSTHRERGLVNTKCVRKKFRWEF